MLTTRMTRELKTRSRTRGSALEAGMDAEVLAGGVEEGIGERGTGRQEGKRPLPRLLCGISSQPQRQDWPQGPLECPRGANNEVRAYLKYSLS